MGKRPNCTEAVPKNDQAATKSSGTTVAIIVAITAVAVMIITAIAIVVVRMKRSEAHRVSMLREITELDGLMARSRSLLEQIFSQLTDEGGRHEEDFMSL